MYVLKIGQVGPPSIKSSVYYKHPQYVKLDSGPSCCGIALHQKKYNKNNINSAKKFLKGGNYEQKK